MFQDIEIFQQCFENIIGTHGLLKKRNFKIPSELKKVSLIDLEKYNKEPFYSINISDEYRTIYVIFVNDITLFKPKKKVMNILNILKILKIKKTLI